MLAINNLKTGTYIVLEGEPFVILKHDFVKMGRGQGVMRTTVKNLKTGKTLERSFKGSDKIEAADISTYDQFFVTEEQLGGNKKDFLKENLEVDVLNFNNAPINIELPKKIKLSVTSSPPGVRGDTAQGSVTKKVTLETGYVVDTPLFIKQGDKVEINTETGKYVGKA